MELSYDEYVEAEDIEKPGGIIFDFFEEVLV